MESPAMAGGDASIKGNSVGSCDHVLAADGQRPDLAPMKGSSVESCDPDDSAGRR